MPWSQFWIANIGSALIWAPALLLLGTSFREILRALGLRHGAPDRLAIGGAVLSDRVIGVAYRFGSFESCGALAAQPQKSERSVDVFYLARCDRSLPCARDAGERCGTDKLLAAWVQMAPGDLAEAQGCRSMASNCPAVTIDGKNSSHALRAAANAAFPDLSVRGHACARHPESSPSWAMICLCRLPCRRRFL